MRKRNLTNNYVQRTVARELASWKYFVVIALCGFVLAAGFFLAAKQHFSSMDLGIKNSKLREQLKALESENRRLLLSREVAFAPEEIKRAAINLGFHSTQPEIPMVINTVAAKSNSQKRPLDEIAADKHKTPTVQMTAYQKPVAVLTPSKESKTGIKEAKLADGKKTTGAKNLDKAVAKLR